MIYDKKNADVLDNYVTLLFNWVRATQDPLSSTIIVMEVKLDNQKHHIVSGKNHLWVSWLKKNQNCPLLVSEVLQVILLWQT